MYCFPHEATSCGFFLLNILFLATACLNNTYGTGCSGNCGHCVDWEECDHVNGVCHNGCEAGYYSDRCKRGTLYIAKNINKVYYLN